MRRRGAGRARGIRRAAALLLAAGLAAATPRAGLAKKKPAEKPPTAATPAAGADTSEVLYRIGGQPLTRADVQRRLDELPEGMRSNFATPEGRQQLLDRMVEERIWLLTAEREGVPERPKVQQQIASQRRDLVIRTYVTEVMGSNPAPGDSELKAYYDSHAADFHVPATATVRHIQTRSRDLAHNVLRLVRAKQDWNKLCMKYSTDSLSRGNGGYLGSVTRDGQFPILGRQPALAESVFALGAGKIGGPWKAANSWHVIKVEEVVEEGQRSFDQVKTSITRQISGQRSQDFYRSKLDDARKRLGVTPDSAAIKRYTTQKKGAREMFKDAQDQPTAEARIAAYRSLLTAYPDSEVCAQAAFMVGFTYSEELKNYDAAEKAFRELLARYPKSELAASAQWMIAHMRTEEAPAFVQSAADSLATTRPAAGAPGNHAGKP